MPIPREGDTFRLLGYQSQKVLVAHNDHLTDYNESTCPDENGRVIWCDKTGVGMSPGANYPDRRFTFEEGVGTMQGTYRLRSADDYVVVDNRGDSAPRSYGANYVRYGDEYFIFETHYSHPEE
ncbi:hypothetical protein BDV25DRAFT_137250 [Aspergillus avenaceus]|uniref:Uncharacterized protein n=1 Tax=Aspergillus avenaceus TaxID=36643 RepID=A0A5N6U3B0_ASPAV|nr:hypothetical protein BDV25DRAFT_137250 [Aspergillus avenaceus]